MMAITTRSSISVKPRPSGRDVALWDLRDICVPPTCRDIEIKRTRKTADGKNG
jgi:hypothetical protein